MSTCQSCGVGFADSFKFCPYCGAQSAPAARSGVAPVPKRTEARRTVTILFSDAVGSTALGEQRDPETVRRVLGRVFDMAREVIERHGGTVEKFVGDAIMAAFGVPVVHEDDALRAVRAAEELVERLGTLNVELEVEYGIGIQLRTGVNTGEVATGDPKIDDIFVTGDAVNVAARLEQASPPMEILLGEATYELVCDFVDAEKVEPLKLKGKSSHVPAYRLVGIRDRSPEPESDTRMVGRADAMMVLRHVFEQVSGDKQCRMVTVLGPAGIGKSRLVGEFLASLPETTPVLRGRCLSYGEGITYWPLAEAVREYLDVRSVQSDAQARELILVALQGARDSEHAVEAIADLVGIKSARAAPGETPRAVRRLLEAASAKGPVVVFIDDLHWAEPALLDTLSYLETTMAGSVMLLAAARPELRERREAWCAERPDGWAVRIGALDQDECESLVTDLLGGDVEVSIAGRIHEASAGNPLFIQELVAMLVRDGAVVRKGGRWIAAESLASVPLPPTIEAVLAARIDSLPVPQALALERAAVIGEVFYDSALEAITPSTERELVAASIAELERLDLVEPSVSDLPGHSARRFHHILLRDAAERRIRRSNRAYLHERFADWLEAEAAGLGEDLGEIVGHHLAAAYENLAALGPVDDRGTDLGIRGAGFLGPAGRRAWDRGLEEEARRLLERGARILPPDSAERMELLLAAANVLTEWGDVGAGSLAREAELIARSRGDAGHLALAQMARLVSESMGDAVTTMERSTERDPQKDALISALRAAELLESSDDRHGLAFALVNAGWMSQSVYRTGDSIELGERALALARELGVTRQIGMCYFLIVGPYLSMRYSVPNRIERARRGLEEDASTQYVEVRILWPMARHLARAGKFAEAREAMARAERLTDDIGAAGITEFSAHIRGEIEWYAGDFVESARLLARACDSMRARGAMGLLTTSGAILASVLLDLGEAEQAHDEALAAIAGAEHLGIEPDFMATCVLARSLTRIGRPDEALPLAAELIVRVRGADAPEDLAMALIAEGEALAACGHSDSAQARLGEGIARYESLGVEALAERERRRLHPLLG